MKARDVTAPLRALLLPGSLIGMMAILASLSTPAGPRGEEGTERWKAMLAHHPRVERLIAEGRLELLEAYGGRDGAPVTVLVQGRPAALAEAGGAMPGARARRVFDRIHLQRRTIDSSRGRGPARSAERGGRFEIIQFHGPIKREWLSSLRAGSRARPIAYVPHNAYIVWVEEPSELDSTAVPLQWREPLEPQDRLSPELRSTGEPQDVTVQVASVGDHQSVLEEIRSRSLGLIMEPSTLGQVTNLRVRMSPETVQELVALPEVLWVEPFETPVLHDERSVLAAAGLTRVEKPAAPGYPSWLESRGPGDLGDTIVDVTDSGLDSGGTSVVHPGLRGRVAYAVNFAEDDTLEDCLGHGTNVAGIIAGAPVPGNLLMDDQGYLLGLGMAPTARLGSTRVFSCLGRFALLPGFVALISSSYDNGARIGNNSWGGGGASYNTVDAEYDALVRDANLDPSDGDQGYLPVFSAGNAGPARFSISWPASAKNVLTVGGTESYRPDYDGCFVDDLSADSVNHVVNFSSRGPTADGRIKPDLVAPGTRILSLASNAPNYVAAAVCDAYFPPGQQVLNWSSGTSQAAPHVTGAAAIAAEHYRRTLGTAPSPAMIKAMMINHARDLGFTSQVPSNTGPRPNMDQGWGRVDLGAVLQARARVAIDQQHVMTATGDVVVFDSIVVEDTSSPVNVTLAWTDAPGTPHGWSWVNDLDLIVEAAGQSYRGNVFEDGVSEPGGEADYRNNIESVYLPPGVSSLRVRVEAANIAGDGVPSWPTSTDQDFALYVSNARLVTGAGTVSFLQEEASCGSDLTVRVTDLGLRGIGRIAVRLESGDDDEILLMDENPVETGSFLGSIALSEAAAVTRDGILQTVDAQAVVARYTEPDAETGAPIERSASIEARCDPLVITGARVERAGDTEAVIRWSTSRPADSEVRYGPGSQRTEMASDPKLVTDHEVHLSGLSQCRFHTAAVSSVDATGHSASGPPTPLEFSTGPGQGLRRTLFRDDMEGFSSRWHHEALGNGKDNWELGYPSFGAPAPLTGKSVWGTNLDDVYDVGADSVLVSPVIDLRDAVGSELTLRHFYDITAGTPPFSSNDGGWVELTSDGGSTWTAIDPVGGYPDLTDEDNPYLPVMSLVFAGTLPGWRVDRFDLSLFSGSVIQIRFHLWQDAGENHPTSPGWYIDDVTVTSQGQCHRGLLSLDAEAYGCSSPVAVTLYDTHLNRDPGVTETVAVTASTQAESLSLGIVETEPGSGEFLGTLMLSPDAAPGALAVTEGEQITVSYQDADTGNGASEIVSVSAPVPDCTPPPAPDEVTLMPDGDGRLSVSWTPVDPLLAPDLQGYRVYYDTDGPGPSYVGTGASRGDSPVRGESGHDSIRLSSLGACSPHFGTVTSFDRLGNESGFAPEAVSVAGGPAPCGLAAVAVGRAEAGCREVIPVTVTDGNADTDTAVEGTVFVLARGPSGDSLQVELSESGPATGVFAGSLFLSPTPAPGALHVAEGEEVVVEYFDEETGLNGSAIVSTRFTISDCRGPRITEVAVTDQAEDRAVIRWVTDEPATSIVNYGPDPSLGLVVEASELVADHAVSLQAGLSACSPVFFTVQSTDARLNSTTVPDADQSLSFGTYRSALTLSDDMESGAPGWTHASLSTEPDEWELGSPAAGPPSAYSGANVWGTDLDGLYERGADLALISPPIDLTGKLTATLSFKHWYDIFSSGPPNGLDDGAFVEVSPDGGATWIYILPTPETPYTDTIARNSYIPFQSGAYAGSSNGWVDAVFELDQFVGSIIKARFHLVQDVRDKSNPTTGAGWYIDDLKISVGIPCHQGEIELGRSEYTCGAGSVRVRVTDLDLDRDSLAIDGTTALVTSDSEPGGETVALTETGPSTGVFDAEIPIATADAAGTLAIHEDDTIVARYDDADDGTGVGRTAEDSARIIDCRAPVISDVRVDGIRSDSFDVHWMTSEPSAGRVLYGTDPSLGSAVDSPGLSQSHSITVGGLQPCAKYFVSVVASDELDNTARVDPPLSARTADSVTILQEGFDAGAAGWTHRGQGDTWHVGPMATTAHDGTYERLPSDLDSDFVLVSPPLNLAGVTHPVLTFSHTYDFATFLLGSDGGWVEAWDGFEWLRLDPQGGYTRLSVPEASPTRKSFELYGGAGGGFATFDLTPVADRVTRVRFRVFLRGGIATTGAGWSLDDVAVSAFAPCRAGRLVFETDSVTCSAAAVSLALTDRDLDLDSAAPDSFAVTVESDPGPASLQQLLLETGPTTATFVGAVALSSQDTPGSLRIAAGDRLKATYTDADDGTGTVRSVQAMTSIVACTGPAISRFSATSDGTDLRLRWATDRPGTTEAVLAPPSGPSLGGGSHRLGTSHEVLFPEADACTLYTATVASEDADGNRTVLTGPSDGLVAENTRRTILFSDDMEGPDPGWVPFSTTTPWERGAPTFGPPSAFSGQNVYATDLSGPYLAGTDSALTSPPIDLTGASAPRLGFWHWFDSVASDPPNSFDDAAWVEVLRQGSSIPIYIEPIGGYNDVTDDFNGQPLNRGTPVYAGKSEDWERVEFDLTPFVGQEIMVRFRFWHDATDLLVIREPGAGWYLDDFEVWEPRYCFPAPVLAKPQLPALSQGGTVSGLAVTGSGFRPGLAVSLGKGITVSGIEVPSSSRITFDVTVEPGAAIGNRDLRVVNPDGQLADAVNALQVLFMRSRADLNGSGRVDGADLILFAGAFGTLAGETGYFPAADLNADAIVDGVDLALLAANFGARF